MQTLNAKVSILSNKLLFNKINYMTLFSFSNFLIYVSLRLHNYFQITNKSIMHDVKININIPYTQIYIINNFTVLVFSS
jgi:hypothetical protein